MSVVDLDGNEWFLLGRETERSRIIKLLEAYECHCYNNRSCECQCQGNLIALIKGEHK